MYKAIILDFDGTIADTEEIYNQAIYQSLKNSGFTYSLSDVKKYTFLDSWQLVNKLARKKRSTVLRNMISILNRKVMKNDIFYSGVIKSLNALSKKYQLFIVSNSYQQVLNEVNKHYHLKFKEVIGRSKKFQSKATAINYLVNKYNLASKNVVYVGDST